MMLWSVKFTTFALLATSASIAVSAGSLYNVRDILRSDGGLEVNLRRGVDEILDNIVRRQDASSPTSTASAPELSVTPPASGDASKINITAWDEKTSEACMTALSGFGGTATNPAGMAICYNLPFLDNSTGVFQADLRLYQIAAPTGDFAGIPSQNIHLGLSYLGATISSANFSALTKRDVPLSWQPTKRQSDPSNQTNQTMMMPTFVEGYAFVGQINRNLLATKINTYVSPNNVNHEAKVVC
jgi:hypothetical protein